MTNPIVKFLIVFFTILLSFHLCFYGLVMGQKTDTNETEDFNFDVAGDFGCNDEARKTIEAIEGKQPELVIGLGDLAYKKNPGCWFEMISQLDNNNKFKIAFGEHDVSRGSETYAQYLNHFNLKKPYYSLD